MTVPVASVAAWNLFDADAGTSSSREVREYYIPDFSDWRDDAKFDVVFHRLLRDLRAPDTEARSG